jgi:pre-rRNA-processing protein IPI3
VQVIEFTQPNSITHPLYDTRLQNTPIQVTLPPWVAPNEAGPALCIGVSYDGTLLLSGHNSGKISQWDTGRRCFSAELADLNAPVTNIAMLSPFPETRSTIAVTVVKPKLGEGHYTFTAQLTGSLTKSHFDEITDNPGFPAKMLEDAIADFSRPATQSSSGDEKLLKENEDLWKIINEQRAVQKKTWDKYSQLKTSDA